MNPVPFALIGTGGIAQSYIQAFKTTPLATLAAVVDTRREVAQALGQSLGIPGYGSLDECLAAKPTVEAAILCTPPNTHEELTTRALIAGWHVLCEKPFTLTPSSARRMITVAQKVQRLVTMASKFRCVDDVIQAKQKIADGLLGNVILFENAFTSRVDMTQRWNSNPLIAGGGVLVDNGTHSVDLMRYFLGTLSEVHAVEGKRIQNLPVEDTARIFVRSQSGVMGSVDLSWSLNKELDWYVTIYGSQGTLQIGWKQSRYKLASSQEWVTFGRGYHKVEAFRTQIENFAAAVRGEVPLMVTPEDAIASVDCMDAVYRSLRAAPWEGVRSAQDLTHTPAPVLGSLEAIAESLANEGTHGV